MGQTDDIPRVFEIELVLRGEHAGQRGLPASSRSRRMMQSGLFFMGDILSRKQRNLDDEVRNYMFEGKALRAIPSVLNVRTM